MNLSEFDFDLPPDSIAQFPVTPRDHSRLLQVSQSCTDHHFYDLPHILRPGDVVVLNDTKVIPARLFGKKPSGGEVEIMLVEPGTDAEWLALIRPAKRVKTGDIVKISNQLSVEIIEKNACPQLDVDAAPLHRVRLNTPLDWEEALGIDGHIPLPPYIRGGKSDDQDRERYQTVVAKQLGAVAAPTAGLHFTDDLMFKLRAMGVCIETITLHVGIGTFRPIATENLALHRMHQEHYVVPESTANAIHCAKQSGHRVIAVGTTVTRCLESATRHGMVVPGPGSTSIFIRPGYQWQCIDGLITNFHLPKSSLIVLVSAFAGIDPIRHAYRYAIRNGYRFYSYGDAMMLWAAS